MDNIGTAVITFTFMSVLCLQPVLTLRCYICDSMQTADCGDKFRVLPSEASNCATGSRCVKFRGFRGSGVVKSPEVERYCDIDYETNGCRDAYRNGIDGEACVCNTELCNTGRMSTYSLWGLSISILLQIILSLTR